ncbi:SH3 domain-containing protein [Lysobacter enzymogenes]|nr:SH3 domain-containing protein [Lysobacter enzymogenes]
MPRMAAVAAAVLVVVSAAAPVRAQTAAVAAPPAGETACSFGAFVAETDPAGLNVRAGPGTAHKVLGTLPPVRHSHDDPPLRAMVEVEVVAGDDGWFKIRAARDNDALIEGPQRPMFKGEGWVSGRKLTVKSQAQAGRQRPDAAAPIAIGGGADGAGFDSDSFVEHARLLGCKGRWALVEYGPWSAETGEPAALQIAPAARAGAEKGRIRAWMNHLCALQETSCDGA